MFVLHRCDNPACVNPEHLFLGTNHDNVRDMIQKGRNTRPGTYCPGFENAKRGTEHHGAKINDEQVMEIRRQYAAGEGSYRVIGLRFGINQSAVFKIVKRKHWKHVK